LRIKAFVVKVLLLHNYYQQPGGEDIVVEQEKALLESKGHRVRLLTAHNDAIYGVAARCQAALGSIYSPHSKKQVGREIRSFQPDIVHVHNFFPLLSPSVYDACKANGVPVVQTLHNFRLICPSALLFREGKPCDLCVGKRVPWPAIQHACYRDSRTGSAAITAMLAVHHRRGTWNSSVDAYITLTNFSRQKLIAGKLPADRLFVKPNFLLPDPGRRRPPGTYALFVGRLSPEKGIRTLLSAWARLSGNKKLKIVGTGPLEQLVRDADCSSRIHLLGYQTQAAVVELMKGAAFVLLPSEWYECFPRVLVESFAIGRPVVASRLGSLAELVDHGRTGVLFKPGDPQALADAIEWMFSHPMELEQMSQAAREEFEAKYTADRNYEQLVEIYQYALDTARSPRTDLSTC
jgi:glycosyltransferase involved in cell wall biosynthesis